MSDEEKIEALRNALERCVGVMAKAGLGEYAATREAESVLDETE